VISAAGSCLRHLSFAQPSHGSRIPPAARSGFPAEQPLAFATDGQRAGRRGGRMAGARARRRPGPRRRPPRYRAISATLRSSAAEMLKSSLHPAGERIAASTPSRCRRHGQRVGLLAAAEDLERPLTGEDLAIRSGRRARSPAHRRQPPGRRRWMDGRSCRAAELRVRGAAVGLAVSFEKA